VEAEQPAAVVPTIKTLTEQRITPDTPVVAVHMMSVKARELVALRTRVGAEAQGLLQLVAVAVAAPAVPVKQNLVLLLLPMVASDYLATSRALWSSMAVVAADLPPTVRMAQLAQVATAAVALAAKYILRALQA
jgi:hypothetical protein